MLKKLLIILPILTFVSVIGLLIYTSGKTYFNDDYVNGNSSGNLYNGGLFCEYNNRIYFSNDSDDGSLYSMDLNLDNVKKIHSDKAVYINADDNYIYYVRANNTKANHTASILMFYSTGIYRINKSGKNLKMICHSPAGLLSLSGNYLFYQRYEVDKGLNLYYSKIDGSGEKFITEEAIVPADIHNNTLIYNGLNKNHSIYSMDLESLESTSLLDYNAMYPILAKNQIYYLNLDDNYSIYRTNMDGSDNEKLIDARCSTYNITEDGTYLYYQIDDGKNNGIHRINLLTMEDEAIQNGNFKQINITSKYVFFKDFDNTNTYMLAANGTGKLGTFQAPVIEDKK